MNAFIVKVLAFLLIIFPGCGSLQAQYQAKTFPGRDIITEEIMTAIKTQDVAAIETMMSLSNRQNTKDLPGEINRLVGAIDGEIIGFSWTPTGGSDESNYGTKISRTTWKIEFKTTTKSYLLYVGWVIVNNRETKEVGLSSMVLLDPDLRDTDDFWRITIPSTLEA